MGKMSQKEKNAMVALLVAIVVVLSGIMGAVLLEKERTTGGMDVLWTQKTGGQTDSFYMNGSVIINDFGDKEIRSINDHGNVAWTYQYSNFISILPYKDGILLIDQGNGTKTLKCLDDTGTIVWTHSYEDQRVLLGDIAVDGNFYTYPQGNGTSGTDTIMCVGIDGSVKWEYSVPDGMLSVRLICPDGTAILQHQGGSMKIESELISISSNGTVLGILDWSQGPDNWYKDIQLASNGTLLSIAHDDRNMTSDTVGMTEGLQTLWSVQGGPYDQPVPGQGSLIYYLETSTIQLDPGQERKVTALCAYNTSSNTFVYRTNFSGSLSWKIWVDSDRVFMDCDGEVWAVDPEGRAYNASTSTGWQDFGLYDGGLLLFSDTEMKMIGEDDSTAWQYEMDGVILSIYSGGAGTIIVVTNDAVTAINKPTISTNLIYLLGLIAFDLLLVLTASIWLLDHRSPKDENTL
jgi:hypothetical protein